MFFKIGVLIKFPKTHKKISVLESPFHKITGLMACNLIKKETPPQAFSCEYHKIFENSFFYGTLPVAASENGWNICIEEFVMPCKGVL